MANKKWLNHYIAREGDWQSGDAISIDEDKEVTFSSEGGANVRLYETSRSGCVLISKTGGGGEAVAVRDMAAALALWPTAMPKCT